MARRFGRNQRRRAREALASEQAAHSSTSHQLAAQKQQVAALRLQLDDVAEILGTDFLGLSARLHAFEIPDRWSSLQIGDEGGNVHTMHVLDVDSSEGWMRSAIHLRAQLAGGEVRYCLSTTALHRAPAEVLAKGIAREMAPLLVSELRRRGFR